MTDLNDTLLVLLNPREIPECMAAWHELRCPKVRLARFTEWEIQQAMRTVVEKTHYRFYVVTGDDGIHDQQSLELVRDGLNRHPVVTGYSNLDMNDQRVNLSKQPLVGVMPHVDAYGELWTIDEVEEHPELAVPTGYCGFSMTGMSRAMWQRFPFGCFGGPVGGSWASDFHLSIRLRDARIPMVAARGAFIYHVKELVGHGDLNPEKQLLVGIEPSGIHYDLLEVPA